MLRQTMLVILKINAFVLRIFLLTPVHRTDKLLKKTALIGNKHDFF